MGDRGGGWPISNYSTAAHIAQAVCLPHRLGLVWGTPPLALNGGSGTDAVMILSVSQCTLRANQIQAL